MGRRTTLQRLGGPVRISTRSGEIGTGLALLPESAFAFAGARIPAGSVTASLLLLSLLLPAGLARLLHERTDGSPLFMGNVVDSWIDQGLLVEEGGRWNRG